MFIDFNAFLWNTVIKAIKKNVVYMKIVNSKGPNTLDLLTSTLGAREVLFK